MRHTFLHQMRFVCRLRWTSSPHLWVNDYYFLNTRNRGSHWTECSVSAHLPWERFTALCLFLCLGCVIGLEKKCHILNIGPQDRFHGTCSSIKWPRMPDLPWLSNTNKPNGFPGCTGPTRCLQFHLKIFQNMNNFLIFPITDHRNPGN